MKIKEEEKVEIIHKEIDLIQNCINRMAKNSFMIKGWLVSLIAIILAIKPKEINIGYLIIILSIITICFWYLDAFFLKTERTYRIIYEYVITERQNDRFENLYNLNKAKLPCEVQQRYQTISNVMFSKTLITFYSIPIVIMIISYHYFI